MLWNSENWQKTWRIAVVCLSIFTAKVFYSIVVGMFGGDEAIGASVLTSILLEILTPVDSSEVYRSL